MTWRVSVIQRTSAQIENEAILGSEEVGSLQFTSNWLVQYSGSTFKATRFDDVVWLYRHTVQRKSYGVTTGKTHSAMIWDRHGTSITVQGKEEQVNTMLTAVMSRAPWAVGGYNDQLNNGWKKDRSNFIAAVDRRKQEAGQQR